MSHATPRERDGFALPVAVFALVILGVLVTGGFFVARQEHRIGISGDQAATALYMAERGIANVVGDAPFTMFSDLAVWSDTTVVQSLDEGDVNVTITRTGNRTFFFESDGTVTRGGSVLGGANRRIGMVGKIFAADLDPPAALTTVDGLRIGGSSEIDGNDDVPGGWDGICDPAAMEDKPGVLMDDTTAITYDGKSYSVDGNPALAEEDTLTSEDLLMFGDLTWDDLVALADKVLTDLSVTITQPDSVLVNGSYKCNKIESNWGDPLNPGAVCGNYFPIIYAPGNLSINSGSAGQGILLVEGDLMLNGGYLFYGPVFVKGTLTTQGTGGHIQGGVVAANADIDASKVSGNALVQYSSCTVEQAVLNNPALARIRPLADRSWVDLSSVAVN